MTAKARNKTGHKQFKIESEMTIYNAAEMKSTLMDTLNKCKELEIDLTKVGEMDSAGIQLLLLAKREAADQNKQLRLINHSDATLELFNLYQIADHFGDPIVLKHKRS